MRWVTKSRQVYPYGKHRCTTGLVGRH
ncbi:hypothetical protein RSAG8_01407, partial [Rhizoctonia solani AG-8 WAC10335]